MRRPDRVDGAFFLLLILECGFLGAMGSSLSLSIYEARIYHDSSLVSHLARFFIPYLGAENLTFKIPFIALHLLNLILFYGVSRTLLKRPMDALWSSVIFALLPGVNAAALLVSHSGILLSVALLVSYMHQRLGRVPYAILIAVIFIDPSVAILFLALFFYALAKRQTKLWLFALAAFAICMYGGGIEVGGKPKGYFLDTLGIFGALFSPLLFLYFMYALYRILLKEEKPLLWYISTVALLFALLLSFRQRLPVESFAPWVLAGLPLMMKVFFSGLRVRLPRYRLGYRLGFGVVVASLLVSFVAMAGHKILYRFLENPRDHFAYRYHIAGELAAALKAHGITEVQIGDKELRQRLACYGIKSGGGLELARGASEGAVLEIPIRYFDYEVERYHVQRR